MSAGPLSRYGPIEATAAVNGFGVIRNSPRNGWLNATIITRTSALESAGNAPSTR